MKKTTRKERFEVLMEDIDEKLALSNEHTSSLLELKPAFEKMSQRIEHIEHDVAALKVGHQLMSENIKELRSDMKEVKGDLKQKVDKQETVKLDHRVTKLEAKTAMV